jgi:hypothetical protein
MWVLLPLVLLTNPLTKYPLPHHVGREPRLPIQAKGQLRELPNRTACRVEAMSHRRRVLLQEVTTVSRERETQGAQGPCSGGGGRFFGPCTQTNYFKLLRPPLISLLLVDHHSVGRETLAQIRYDPRIVLPLRVVGRASCLVHVPRRSRRHQSTSH